MHEEEISLVKEMSPPFLNKHFYAKKTNLFLEEKLFWFNHDETDKIYLAKSSKYFDYH